MITQFNAQKETKEIIAFIKTTLYSAGFKKVVIALSGGIDSAVTAFLAVKALGVDNVLIARLPYNTSDDDAGLVIKQLKIPKTNVFEINIKPVADLLWEGLIMRHSEPAVGETKDPLRHTKEIGDSSPDSRLDSASSRGGFVGIRMTENLRLGNIMARVRMIFLYDLAKANKALVCGTENKSEHLLGYYTLHGDSASDLEPIAHLYKTQVRELAKYLAVPKKIIDKVPTAGLWPGQTDEGELGFTYQEADQILSLFFDQKYSQEKIILMGFKKETVNKVITRMNSNSFKKKLPYHLA